MTDWPGPIAAITLFAENLAATKQFYFTVFQLPAMYEDADSCVFMFGGTMINLLRASEAAGLIAPATPGGPDSLPRSQFTLEVDDVDAQVAELVALGIEILNGPMNRAWGIRTAAFQDPTGTIWELSGPLVE